MRTEERIADVMTPDPICLDDTATVTEAARKMREADIGPIIVTSRDDRIGILTDRDIVTRVVADGRDPDAVTLNELATWNPECVTPDDPVDQAVSLMRSKAIRRLPVIQDGRPVGIVSLGDLAIDRDPDSALADISKAAPNN